MHRAYSSFEACFIAGLAWMENWKRNLPVTLDNPKRLFKFMRLCGHLLVLWLPCKKFCLVTVILILTLICSIRLQRPCSVMLEEGSKGHATCRCSCWEKWSVFPPWLPGIPYAQNSTSSPVCIGKIPSRCLPLPEVVFIEYGDTLMETHPWPELFG